MLRMERKVVEMAFGIVKYIGKRMVETADGQRLSIRKAIMLTEDTFLIQFKAV